MQRFEGNIVFAGRITPEALDIPAGALVNAGVASNAGLAVGKLEHQHQPPYAQESDTTAAAEDRVIHTVYGLTGKIEAFAVGCVVANVGAAVVTFDLHKNGATVLTATVDVDSGDAAYAVVEATVDPAEEDLAADDVLEVIVTVAAGGGTLGKGVFARTVISEDAV